MKVLLAEDDAVTRYILQEMLAVFGYEVTACADGEEAWDAFCAGDFRLVAPARGAPPATSSSRLQTRSASSLAPTVTSSNRSTWTN